MDGSRPEISEEDHLEDEKLESPEKSHFDEAGNLKPNEKYEVNGYEYETDSKGRIKHCEGDLRLEDGKRNPAAQREVGGADRHTGDGVEYDLNDRDDGGHLIATRFGGSGEKDNLVAQNYNLNRGEYKKMENGWANTLEEKDGDGNSRYNVHVEIKPVYRGDSERPGAFIVNETITDRESGEVISRQTRRFRNDYQG